MDDITINTPFFVKEEIGNTTIRIAITEENVVTVCPKCGKEHHLNLDEFYCALGVYYDDGICCDDCAPNGKLPINRKVAEYDEA